MLEVHFVDVGQGNMTLIDAGTWGVVVYDCNITDDNENVVLPYTKAVLAGRRVKAYMNSHRDADHMRGVARLHKHFGIDTFWDCGVCGSTTDSTEYQQYMSIRRQIGCGELVPGQAYALGPVTLMVLGAANAGPFDANTQSAVVRVSFGGKAVMLTGDSDVRAWKSIRSKFSDAQLKSVFLLGGHHGSDSFFEDEEPAPSLQPSYASLLGKTPAPPFDLSWLASYVSEPPPQPALPKRRLPLSLATLASLAPDADVRRRQPGSLAWLGAPDSSATIGSILAAASSIANKKIWYTDHIKAIQPAVTILSVGSNSHGHPTADALRLYEQHSSGRDDGRRVLRTDRDGTIRCGLNADGSTCIRGLKESKA